MDVFARGGPAGDVCDAPLVLQRPQGGEGKHKTGTGITSDIRHPCSCLPGRLEAPGASGDQGRCLAAGPNPAACPCAPVSPKLPNRALNAEDGIRDERYGGRQ